MKLFSVIIKSLKEQFRSFWVFILTILMAPFFVFVYYLINEGSQPNYDILVLNHDKGIIYETGIINLGNILLKEIEAVDTDSLGIPLTLKISDNKPDAISKLKNRKADALIIIPENFSECVNNLSLGKDTETLNIEFLGDLTNLNYMISAVWANEIINDYLHEATGKEKIVQITETGVGLSAKIDDFDIYVPGILILSLIMLMFSATLAMITEVENKTSVRINLSKITALEFLSGVGIVQLLVGIISVILTLLVAVSLGFDYSAGSFGLLLLISVLTSISIIAFSLINAAITKSANEVLIVVNFPLFLFMFFSGAAFPLNGKELFSIAGYPFTIQGLMSPTHSIAALKKVMILDMGLKDILPEISAVIIITIIYFIIGVWAFNRRHMKTG